MARSEDGEFELVLGNRQLLSVFFIVVVLLGVFFTMGYIVGRNSAPVVAEAQKKSEPLTVDSAPPPLDTPPSVIPKDISAPASTAPQLPSDAGAPAVPAAEKPAPEKPPEKKDPKKELAPVKTDAIPAAKADPLKSDPEAARIKAEEAKKARVVVSDQPQSGQAYLQLAATSKREADVMVDVLREKGFKALAAEIEEKPGMFRVLVGPVGDGNANSVRADLQKSGFPGNAAIRRTF